MTTARFTLVRHAESTANATRRLSGHDDVPLSEVGRQQAAALAVTLRDEHFDRVLGSDLQRVRDTAAPLLVGRGLAPLWLPSLRERDFGEWCGQSIDEARRRLDLPDWQQAILTWDQAPPGGETWEDLTCRVLTALATLDAPGHTLLVSHGGVIRVLAGLVERLPRTRIPYRAVGNTEVLRLTVPVGTWLKMLMKR